MASKLTKFLSAAGAVALMGWAGQALAVEGPSPYLPGDSVGSPAGALPPPGYYFVDQNVLINGGPVNGGSGSFKAPVNVSSYLNIPTLLWSTGWSILGSDQYVMALTQPFLSPQSLTVAGTSYTSTGAFNTIFSPINLNWKLPNSLFAKVGLAIYADDGYITEDTLASGKKVLAPTSVANDYWTFEPDFGLSYLQGGWDFTGHVVLDFNTENNATKVQSGDIFYLDLTAGKSIGKWIVGAGGNFTQQFTCDSGSGNTAGCNEVQRVLIGPYIGYNFGPVELDAKAMFAVHTENGANLNFYYTSFSFPF
jgi:hypothetical protein